MFTIFNSSNTKPKNVPNMYTLTTYVKIKYFNDII